MGELLETIDLVTNFYTYEGVVKALNRVSLVVEHGSTFGLVGESGCGKSVTVRSIMRIVQEPGRIESGKVLVFFDEANREKGIDLLQQTETYMERLRGDQISMIFQEPNAALNPTMSIGNQVAESYLFHQKKDMYRAVHEELTQSDRSSPIDRLLIPLYHLAGNKPESLLLRFLSKMPILAMWQRPLKREVRKRCVDIVEKLGIPNAERILDAYPHNLSGGMKQRIVIAIALACSPVLLIADEATSNLDVTIQAQIIELLKRLKEDVISSILLITHDLGVVAETCDRVGVMYAGHLCEVAGVRELFNNPLHPYTKALLDSVPKFAMEGALRSIDGAVPNLVNPPSGCRFHPRCPLAMDVCSKEDPPLRDFGKDHWAACYQLEGGLV